MDSNQTCRCPLDSPSPSGQQPSIIILVVGLALSALSFLVAILTFFTNVWQLYVNNEWQKSYSEVELAREYTPAAQAAWKIASIKKEVDDLKLSPTQSASSSAERLDYADIYFMYRTRGVLPGGIQAQLTERGYPPDRVAAWVTDLEESRLKAAVFWDRAAGMLYSHQLLPEYSPTWQRVRTYLGLPCTVFIGPKWEERGLEHRKLVEPLDIAHWYSMRPPMSKPYSDDNNIRPPRYSMFGRRADEDPRTGEYLWERYQGSKQHYASEDAPQKTGAPPGGTSGSAVPV